MALFRRFFYRKPPDGLLEISERVFVFDCCFTTDVLEDDEYKVYMGGIVGQLREYFPEASFMVFNFREGEYQSQIASVLSNYDMTVMDYPRQYESCPVLTMEMIQHFLRSSESWLSLGQRNVLLMHCERGGWPVLAFMLAALLIYRKQYTGEQKTLDMVYKQAPRELLQFMSPLNPLPSQLRYLQYVSRRNVVSEWPPMDRAVTLDCIILRFIPNMDGEGGCRPIFRIYGQDPFIVAGQTPKVLFSTPKRSKLVRQYKQADCELVKIDIHCHIQGDVVLECITLFNDLNREEMMFRVMFNTAFIRSNILMLNRDEIDILWNAKDQFPKDFRAEVLFSEMDSTSSLIPIDLPGIEDKEGLPIEAFSRVQEIFSNVDWLETKADVELNALQQITTSNVLQDKLVSGSLHRFKNLEIGTPESARNEKLESVSSQSVRKEDMQTDSPQNAKKETLMSGSALSATQEKLFSGSVNSANEGGVLICSSPEEVAETLEPKISNNDTTPSVALKKQSASSLKPSLDVNLMTKKIDPQELQVALQRPAQSKIISPRIHQTSLSNPASYCSSLQGSPTATSRYHSATSVGITALLHDDAEYKVNEGAKLVTLSPSAVSASLSNVTKQVQLGGVSTLSLPETPSIKLLPVEATTVKKASVVPPPPSLPLSISNVSPSNQSHSLLNHNLESSLHGRGQLASVPPLPPPPALFGAAPLPRVRKSITSPLAAPPPPPFPGKASSQTIRNSFVTPHPPPPSAPSMTVPSPTTKSSSPTPPPPPPLLLVSSTSSTCSISPPLPIKSAAILSSPPPPPPPLHPLSGSGPSVASSAPIPPSPNFAPKGSLCKNFPSVPPIPPPPAPSSNGLLKAGGASPQSHSAGAIPPAPGQPFSARGRLPSRINLRNQPKKASLKPYHWLKLTRAVQGSLWAEAQKNDEASKAPEFDMSELESLFSATVPNSHHGSTGGKSNRRASGPKSDKVHLIELRRAYNCEIMLSKVKVPLPDLMGSVLALDDLALDVDQVDNLIKFCPTKEEIELLKNYTGDKENLGKCEQFFLELMKVPRVESKLRVFSFKIQFCSQVSDLRNNLNIVNSASGEVRNSVKLKRIMQTILSLGNALNHGTARGSAVGFRLDSLLKLTDTRSRNKKLTLMHYLCKVLAEKLPELLDFPKDLVSLEASTKIQLKYLAEEMQAISKGLEKVVQELTASENDGPVSENFCKMLKEFLSFVEAEVRFLASLYSGVGRNADALALYFGEDPARCPFEQVVSTLLNFVRMFVQAHVENCKQLEFEKKRAQKEAHNEKAKNSTLKESENQKLKPDA